MSVEKAEQPENLTQGEFWDNRYAKEGHIWGDEPSLTAKFLAQNLSPNSTVIDVGFGYGRDIVEMVQNGHRVTGLEESGVGFAEAHRQIADIGKTNQVHLMLGEFTTAELREKKFDAVYSHRVIHLLGNNGLVRAFATRAANALKPGGLLFVSARDERDFDESQMRKIEQSGDKKAGTLVEYTIPGRQGHLITLWNEAMFRSVFESQFEIMDLIPGEEIEAKSNADKMSHFTLMVAHKKDKPTVVSSLARKTSAPIPTPAAHA